MARDINLLGDPPVPDFTAPRLLSSKPCETWHLVYMDGKTETIDLVFRTEIVGNVFSFFAASGRGYREGYRFNVRSANAIPGGKILEFTKRENGEDLWWWEYQEGKRT